MSIRSRLRLLIPRNSKVAPFRLGIWCDYYRTVTPYGSVGIIVHNLVEGLLQLDEPVEVVLLIRSGEEHVVSRLKAIGGDRLHLIPETPGPTYLQRIVRRLIHRLDKAQLTKEKLCHHVIGKFALVAQNSQRTLGRLFKLVRAGNWAVAAMLVAVLPVIFLSLWVGYSLVQVAKALFKTVMFPVRLLDRLIQRLQDHGPEGSVVKIKTSWPRRPASRTSIEAAQDAHCDVWLIPWSAFADPLPFPSVLYIHDLVATHHPEMFPDFASFFNRVTPVRAAEAILCACMSEFNRDHDLIGVLNLPPAKVRIVRPAPPRDFPLMSREHAQSLKPAHLNRPYLFMPDAICPAKNQQALIESLRILRDQFGEDQWDVVFTGGVPGYLGASLQQLVAQYRLQGRVHVVGMVDCEMLAALFNCAWATIMPTLYERGSFPVLEALYWECPVACSDLPPLREQYASMGEAMMYFDPRKPEDLARTILKIRDDRENIRAQQFAASRILRQRTWQDVAREWLAVFKEAAEIASNRSRHLPSAAA